MAARHGAASTGPRGSTMGRSRRRRRRWGGAEPLMKGPDNLFLPPPPLSLSLPFPPPLSILLPSPRHPTQSLALCALEHLLQIPAQYSSWGCSSGGGGACGVSAEGRYNTQKSRLKQKAEHLLKRLRGKYVWQLLFTVTVVTVSTPKSKTPPFLYLQWNRWAYSDPLATCQKLSSQLTFMSLLLCCVTEERHYLGIMIIIYLPSINQIPTAHCVYYSFFFFCLALSLLSSPASVYCSTRATWIHICFSLFTYCFIDGHTLERPCTMIFFTGCCFVFVCFSSEIQYIWGISYSFEWDYSTIEIINKLPLLPCCLNSHATLRDQHEPLWASMQSKDFEWF